MEKQFFLRDGETIDSLGDGIGIIISDKLPRFTNDALMLAKFAAQSLNKNDHVFDMGSGTGIIGLMLHQMTGAVIRGFEIQDELCALSMRSVALNSLEDVVCFEHMDYREAYKKYNGAFTAGVCNPPYFSKNRGEVSPNQSRSISRSMDEDGLAQTLHAASRLIKTGGKFFMCYPVEGLTDAMYELRCHGLEPKKIRFVCANENSAPTLSLIEARRGGGRGLSVDICVRG